MTKPKSYRPIVATKIQRIENSAEGLAQLLPGNGFGVDDALDSLERVAVQALERAALPLDASAIDLAPVDSFEREAARVLHHARETRRALELGDGKRAAWHALMAERRYWIAYINRFLAKPFRIGQGQVDHGKDSRGRVKPDTAPLYREFKELEARHKSRSRRCEILVDRHRLNCTASSLGRRFDRHERRQPGHPKQGRRPQAH